MSSWGKSPRTSAAPSAAAGTVNIVRKLPAPESDTVLCRDPGFLQGLAPLGPTGKESGDHSAAVSPQISQTAV